MAHNLVLHIETKSSQSVDVPVRPDPARGGFVLEDHSANKNTWDGEISGVIRGSWGFQSFNGPRFRLRASRPGQWTVASKDASALIVGREDTLHLQSADSCCVSDVMIKGEDGKVRTAEWKAAKPEEIEIKVPLQNATPGTLKIVVKKFGSPELDETLLHTYAEAGRLDSFSIHAGDSEGLLKGTRLDEVKSLEINGFVFSPETLSRANQVDELKLVSKDESVAAGLDAGLPAVARVTLMDGRMLNLDTVVETPRPKLTLLSKSTQISETDSPPMIHLTNPDELPQDGRLSFFLKTQVPEAFNPAEKVEVATADDSFHVLLSVKDGNLTLQDSKTIYAVLDPMKLLGPSAFGPLKFRPVSGDGIEGDWQPLVNLVRMPELKGVRCVASAKAPASEIGKTAAGTASQDEAQKDSAEKECALTGDKLFLIDAVSADPDFTHPVTVPDGFIEASLAIPEPKNKTLYIKLRDDPGTVDTAVVPMLAAQP
jgi:hypothetical protein